MIHNKKQFSFHTELMDMERCLYKGYRYFVPQKAEPESIGKVGQLTLSLDGLTICPGKDAARLFATEAASQNPAEMRLRMDGELDDAASFYLYCEGTEQPVARAVRSMEEYDCFCFSFSSEYNFLHPGKYFLLGKNMQEASDEHLFDTVNGHLCFPFMVLRAGEELAHPVFRKAVVSRPASTLRGGGLTSGALRVSLVADRTKNTEYAAGCGKEEGVELGLACYDRDWHLMARAGRYISGGRFPKSACSVSLHSENIWMPGSYFAVVSHNREPYMLVTFDYQGAETTEGRCRLLQKEEEEYWMVKKLEPDAQKKWKQVRELQGLGHVKRHLVKLSRMNEFNRFCSLHNLGGLRSNTFAVVTASKLFHAKRLAYCLPNLLNFCTESYRQIDCAEWVASASASGGESADGYIEGRGERTLALFGLSALLTPDGQQLLTRIEKAVLDETVFWSLILCGTRDEVEQVFAYAPRMAACFPADTRFDVRSFSVAEMTHLVQRQIEQASFSLDAMSENALAVQVGESWPEISHWGKEEIDRFVCRGIAGRMKQRLRETLLFDQSIRQKELLTVFPEDIALASYLLKTNDRRNGTTAPALFEESMKELNAMVGLHALKEELTAVFYQVRFNEQRRLLGLPAEEDGTYHMIFTGNPGTGKTTVAGMIGKIYHSLGLLSKGEVIATERSQMVGRYIGETEEKMVALLKRAKGNVLFIDEAYTLCDSLEDRKDYGNHAIECLLTLLARPHSDTLVIMAGYADEMERLMQRNQGLKGRFPHKFHFDDYDAGELMQIGASLLERKGYLLSDEAESLLKTMVGEALSRKDRHFGNARWMNQFITSGVLQAMAKRIVQGGMPASVEVYRTIEISDIEQAALKFVKRDFPQLMPRRRIGFIA
ncbi:AAA family ATPase [uncultured Bacteroides sp.]|uniref:AAA family ATPase n=1 Tax=uncultured Bacteroides sp. TaxID=162156 RepID=UPI00260594A1|nr:AAA family ATPase [uncultured Bacteroides sp.]